VKKIFLIVLGVFALASLAYVGWLYTEAQTTTHVLSGTAVGNGAIKHREEAQYFTIEVSYPDHTPLYSWLNPKPDTKARDAIEAFLLSDSTQFKQDLDVDHIAGPEKEMLDSMGRTYAYEATYKAYEATDHTTISYEYDIYVDTGGAHPNGYYHTFVFDRSGTELKLSDLFVGGADYLGRISSAALTQVKAELTKELGMDAADTIFEEGLAPTQENFSNFLIDGDTLVFLIPPYQAAAYAAGNFEVRIPLSQFNDILRQQWK
jgi:hypothetical protein